MHIFASWPYLGVVSANFRKRAPNGDERGMRRATRKRRTPTPPPTPAAKGSLKTKKVTPKTKTTNATSSKTKADKATPSKTKADKKPIDISDLAVLTKKMMKATTRECFTSKAYHAARKRAKHAGKSTDEMKELGRKAYAASAASWDRLTGS